MNISPILSQTLTQTPAPRPDELNASGQVLMGLGLSGAMLIGFVLLVILLIGAMGFMAWSSRREGQPS